MKKLLLNVKGMHCKACETLVKEGLSDIGVDKVTVSLIKNTVDVEYDETKIKESQIKKAIDDEGYRVI